MANGNRRHYRVAQKEVEQASNEIEQALEKKVCLAFLIVLAVICFTKGLIIGFIISSKCCNKKCDI